MGVGTDVSPWRGCIQSQYCTWKHRDEEDGSDPHCVSVLCSTQMDEFNEKKAVQLCKLPFSMLAMVFTIERLPIYKIPGVLNNNNNSSKILTLLISTDYSLFSFNLRQDTPALSNPSCQPQPPPSMESRAVTSKGKGAKPEGSGRAQQSVCHCDNLFKGGGQDIMKYPGLKS